MTTRHPQRRRVLNRPASRALLAALVATFAVSIYGCGDGGSDASAEASAATSAASPSLDAAAAEESWLPAAEDSPWPSMAPDESPSAEASVESGQSAANRAPKIFGAPQRSVKGGTSYEFRPTASDADGDALAFAIAGRPEWASFDRSTGRLKGKPTQNDVGATRPISISVTDGEATTALASFTIEVVGTATGSVSLVWAPPTENEDGTPLRDLAGYKLYWGTAEGSYPNSATLMNPGITRYVVEELTPAEWHFVITALNSRGDESERSNAAIEEVSL
jgi:hypothetical protein